MAKKQHNSASKSIGSFISRFHFTLFFVFIVGCLSGAVIMINKTLTETSADDAYTSSINAGSIDQATLVRVQALHTSSKGVAAPTLPAGRVNPFAE